MASKFLIGRVGVVFLALTTAFSGLSGCSKQDDEAKAKAEQAEEKANKKKKKRKKEKPQGDRYADGKRLANSLGDWSKRWSEMPALPACDPLLSSAADRNLCKTAATALTSLKTAVAKPEAEGVLMHSAAELALASEEASAKLRLASMEKVQAAAAKGTPSGGPPGLKAPPKPVKLVPSALAKDKLQAAGSAEPHAPAAPEDPAMAVMQAYSRVNRASLRYLSQFLQFGPLPTRKAAFAEAQALAEKKEAWPALGRALREAAMAENDPELQPQLKALAPKVSRRPPSPDASGQPAASAAPSPAMSGAPKPRAVPAPPAAAPAAAPAAPAASTK